MFEQVFKSVDYLEYTKSQKDVDAKFDHNNNLTGDNLMSFVDAQLFPYLKCFKQRADNTNTIEYKIGEIFSELKNKIQSGYSLRDALEKIESIYDYKLNSIDELKNQSYKKLLAL
ncbi:hypothetical protein AADZ91_14975 [Colwelliaceae bacterium 6441]